MKKVILTAVAVTVALCVVACGPKATKEECTSACSKWMSLQKIATPPTTSVKDDPVVKINEDFDKKTKELEALRTAALGEIDKAQAAKLAATKKPKDRAKVTDEFTKQRAEKEKSFEPQFKAVADMKAAAVKAAQDKKMADEKAAAEKAKKDLEACSAKCTADGTKKATTDCRTAALKLDEYNACK
jgi:hypothetical protein